MTEVVVQPRDSIHASPWCRVLAALCGGVFLATLIAAVWPLLYGQTLDGFAWLALQAASAAAIAAAIRLAWWWLLCCLLFLPALALGVTLQFAPAWAAICLAVLLLAYGGTQSTRVPLYLSSAAAIDELENLVRAHRPSRVLDLGCGTAGVLSALSRASPEAGFEGVERAPLPFLVAWARSFLHDGSFDIRWQDLWKTDLSDFNLVYAYLSPAPMPRLWEKALREMHSGALLVSFRFGIPGVPPDQIVNAGGKQLFVWRMP